MTGLTINGEDIKAGQGETILEVGRTRKMGKLQKGNVLSILGRQLTGICFKKTTAVLPCWVCCGKVHYDLNREEQAYAFSGLRGEW